MNLVLVLTLFSSLSAQAKDTSFLTSTLSTYLRGGYGTTNAGKNAYQPGFPGTVSFPDTSGVFQGYDGEIGVAMGVGANGASIKLGVEILNPAWTNNLAGKNAGGTQLVSIQSEVFAIIPKLDVEYYFIHKPSFRAFFGATGGYAYATLKNTVSLTAAGQVAFPGVANYVEEGTGNA